MVDCRWAMVDQASDRAAYVDSTLVIRPFAEVL